MNERSESRAAAARTVDDLADRLADSDAVVAATQNRGEHIDVNDVPHPPWDPRTLSRGHGALAIFYAELGHFDDRHRQLGHEYLRLTAEHTAGEQVRGPLEGLGSLASAARVASRDEGDYAGVLGRLDERMDAYARWLIAVQESTRRAGVPTTAGVVDVLSGLSGVGRYLLHRSPRCDATLRDLLSCLAGLRNPLEVQGVRIPGWWFEATSKTMAGEEFGFGQVNFGMSHGIPGPLALLSVAWRRGLRVHGQAEAIGSMADWLLRWREQDDAGHYWTGYVPLRYYADARSWPAPSPARPSWCYGAVGTGRALAIAGDALGRQDWVEAGRDAVHAMLARPVEHWGITDDALCHGWAGLLHCLCRWDWSHPDPGMAAAADRIADRVLADFDPDKPFGYQYYQPAAQLYLDLPGLMEGAAGIGLALHAYAHDSPPVTGWDSLLMLS